MTPTGAVTVQRTGDGEVRILHADARIAVSQDLLDDADPRVLQHGEGLLRIGSLLYRFTGEVNGMGYLVAEFVRTVPPSRRG